MIVFQITFEIKKAIIKESVNVRAFPRVNVD